MNFLSPDWASERVRNRAGGAISSEKALRAMLEGQETSAGGEGRGTRRLNPPRATRPIEQNLP
jgi:hypothetical protein